MEKVFVWVPRMAFEEARVKLQAVLDGIETLKGSWLNQVDFSSVDALDATFVDRETLKKYANPENEMEDNELPEDEFEVRYCGLRRNHN